MQYTNTTYDALLKEKSIPFLRIGDYINRNEKIAHRCNMCGMIFSKSPRSLLEGNGCRYCYYERLKKSNKDYDKDLKESGLNIERIGSYVNNHTPIEHKCLECNEIFVKAPNIVLHGAGCPYCSGYMKNNKIYDKELITNNIKIKRLQDYISSSTKILHKCLVCNYTWRTKPNTVLNGSGCPQCSLRIKTNKKYDKELKLLKTAIVRIDDYLNDTTPILHKCTKCGNLWKARPTNILKERGCPVCTGAENKKRNWGRLLKKLKDVTPLFTLDDYDGVRVRKYQFQCNRCNTIFESSIDNGRIPRCFKCYPKICGTSNVEKEIFNWISPIIKSIPNKRFYYDKYKFYEIDIFIPDKNIGIELDGLYYHSELSGNKDSSYHLNKTLFFLNKDISVVHIFENEWIDNKDLIKSILLNKLQKSSDKIFARNTCVRSISNEERRIFLDDNHLQGDIASKVSIGAFYNDTLCQVLSFGKPRYNKNYEWELLRFATKRDTLIIGGFSKCFKYFLRNFNPITILSYCDRRFSNGNVYIKNGFTFAGYSKPSYYYTRDYTTLENRIRYQKHKLKNKLEFFDKNLTEWENMQMNGYDRIWDCGNVILEYKGDKK